MQSKARVVAIACADIHLQHTAPACRTGEPNWYKAMARPLDEMRALAEKYEIPILCAGDVFNIWNSGPELINWAIKHLPKMYAVPGQHDLPQHRLDDVRKSAYWTLVEAGVIENLPISIPMYLEGSFSTAYGFPWGVPIELAPEPEPDTATQARQHDLKIAIAHQYRWIKGHCYTGAQTNARVSMAQGLTDFDVVIFGDNHSGFLTKVGSKTTVFNCGTLMRRKSDEAYYQPQVGLIYSDGCVVPHLLDTSEDQLDSTKKEAPETETVRMDVREFLGQLTNLSKTSLDYQFAIERYIEDNEVGEATKQILTKVLGV